MVSCGEFLAELGNYLEGELTAELCQELEAHLARCNTCQVIIDSTRKTLKIVTECGERELSEALPDSVVTKIMETIRKKAADHSDAGSGG